MNYFITTTLPYANSIPHVGHLLEFVQADCITRYLNQQNNNVFFNTGLDEHGLKIQNASAAFAQSPQDYVNKLKSKWINFCDQFNIDYDTFYRTTSDSHNNAVSYYWNIFKNKGLITKKTYTGYYCVGCECFKTDHYCVDHEKELEEVTEENYFFDLKPFKNELFVILAQQGFGLPESRRHELANNILNLDEISISRPRERVSWGIPVPDDENHTIYVWFDALLNYLICANNLTPHKWNDYFTIQLCGPDNLKFQGYIFQSFLAALGYKFTNKLLVHGTVLDKNGNKQSKSIGNVIDPIDQLNKYGADAVRWYLLTQSTFDDFKYDEEVLKVKWNELNNKWGNLISRVLNLVEKYRVEENINSILVESDYNTFLIEENFNIKKYSDQIIEEIEVLNKRIEDFKPWETKDKLEIGRLYETLKVINNFLIPFIPAKCEEVRAAIENKKKVILFKKL